MNLHLSLQTFHRFSFHISQFANSAFFNFASSTTGCNARKCVFVRMRVIVGYAPPRPWKGSTAQLRAHAETIDKLYAWIEHELSRTPARLTPVLLMDANTGLVLR